MEQILGGKALRKASMRVTERWLRKCLIAPIAHGSSSVLVFSCDGRTGLYGRNTGDDWMTVRRCRSGRSARV
jgi:hypothetical protein